MIMAYERIAAPKGKIYHYTKKDHVESILRDGCIKRFKDRECWFCPSLKGALRMMELTVMNEGKIYFDVFGFPKRYPRFIPEDYVVLELEPRYQNGDWVRWIQEFPDDTPKEVLELGREFDELKLAYRGNLKFKEHPKVYEVAELLSEQMSVMQMAVV